MTTAISSGDLEGYSKIFEDGWLKKDGNELNVKLRTKDLELRSISEQDRSHYEALYTNPETMRMFVDNEKRLKEAGEEEWKKQQLETVATRVDALIQRWKKGIPFSAFAIYKRGTEEFVGHIVAGFGDKPGESEIGYIIHDKMWNKGYGSQAVSILVQKWMPYLNQQKYETGETVQEKWNGKVVSCLTATARMDNTYSDRILLNNKFVKTDTKVISGFERNIYKKDIL